MDLELILCYTSLRIFIPCLLLFGELSFDFSITFNSQQNFMLYQYLGKGRLVLIDQIKGNFKKLKKMASI